MTNEATMTVKQVVEDLEAETLSQLEYAFQKSQDDSLKAYEADVASVKSIQENLLSGIIGAVDAITALNDFMVQLQDSEDEEDDDD